MAAPRLILGLLLALFAAAAEAERIFVSNEDAGALTVIDARDLAVTDTFAVGEGPRDMGFSPDGASLYVALGPESAIAVVDPRTLAIRRKLPAEGDPEAFGVHPDGRIFLSHEDAAQCLVIDPATGEVRNRIPVGLEPEGVTVTPDGELVLVTSESSSQLHIIDAEGERMVAELDLPPRPREAAVTADSRYAYVTSEVGAAVSRVDLKTRKVIRTENFFDIEGAKPKGVLLTPDGGTLFVSLGKAGEVLALDPESLAVRERIETGGRVWGLGLAHSGKRLFAASASPAAVSVIHTRRLERIRTLDVAPGPWGVTVAPAE